MIGDTAQIDTTLPKTSADYLDPRAWTRHITGNTDWNMVGPYSWKTLTDDASPAASRWYASSSTTSSYYRRPMPYHGGGANIAFCDGHAKWVAITQLIGPMPKGYDRGDPLNLWDNQ